MFSTRLEGLLRLSSVRQTLVLLALFAAISALAWGGTYWLVEREMRAAVDARLTARMQAAVAALDAGDPLPPAGNGERAALAGARGREGFFTVDHAYPAPQFRYLATRTAHGRILLGENIERQEELRDILAGGMQATLIGALTATAIAGVWTARRGQARLDAIGAGLARVAQGKLDAPIALDGPRDDLSLLADRINAATARLDSAMTQLRAQSSNIAHDLRTPLARLRATVETSLVALIEQKRAVTEDDLGEALQQIDRITDTFNALLRLARIESGAGRADFAPLDLGALAEQIAETYAPVVEDAGQTLRLEITDPAQATGDRDLLVQLAANLIQNALRYGPDGQVITLLVHGARLSVSDQGPGIPFAEREKVFQPLYQGETARQGEGFGLGLSLVRAICEQHGAALSLSDGPRGRGLTVSVSFA